MRGTFSIGLDPNALNEFNQACNVAITKVGRGTKKATVAACEEILQESLMQVPRDTHTLAMSGFYEVNGSWIKGWTGTVGYGGAYDPINPKTGQPASQYMVQVHEDLNVYHKIGKAKFLEDPVRDYAKEKFPRTVFKYAQESLADYK